MPAVDLPSSSMPRKVEELQPRGHETNREAYRGLDYVQ